MRIGNTKFGNITAEEDGYRFDSKKERDRYRELKLMQMAGEIVNLELQPQYRFEYNGVFIGRYTADFRYEDTRTGDLVVEDVKSSATRTEAYRLRKKLLQAFYGLNVREI